MSDTTQGQTRSQLRRVPKQERSRERIDEILKVSMELIGRKGIDAVTMKEIAALSGGPIASVYQYFPNKSAIVATLYERYAEKVLGLVLEATRELESREDAFHAVENLVEAYFQIVRGNPSLQDLVNAIQADKALSDIDVSHSRIHAQIFAEATRSFVPEPLHDRYGRTVFLMFHLAVGAVRLALLVGEGEAALVIADFKNCAKVQLGQFINGSTRDFG
jgi:AcrR family transcriptional regulator